MRVVPPWVEEHPDVFSDPDFSITKLDIATPSDMNSDPSIITDAMAMSVNEGEQPMEKRGAWTGSVRGHSCSGIMTCCFLQNSGIYRDGYNDSCGGGSHGNGHDGSHSNGGGHNDTSNDVIVDDNSMAMIHSLEQIRDSPVMVRNQFGTNDDNNMIPEDPMLAETHYSQYEGDFETDDSKDDDEEEEVVEEEVVVEEVVVEEVVVEEEVEEEEEEEEEVGYNGYHMVITCKILY